MGERLTTIIFPPLVGMATYAVVRLLRSEERKRLMIERKQLPPK